MAVPERSGRAFFERQQRRRREAQRRLSGRGVALPSPGPRETVGAGPPTSPESTASESPEQTVLRVVVTDEAGARRVFDLHEGDMVIGREEPSEIRIADFSVSRHHARIQVSGARVTIEDLGSTNGTWHNGVRIEAPVPLVPGDEVEIGAVQLTLEYDEATSPDAS